MRRSAAVSVVTIEITRQRNRVVRVADLRQRVHQIRSRPLVQ
jgi:hypothetical protein